MGFSIGPGSKKVNCDVCRGRGVLTVDSGEVIPCGVCGGQGYILPLASSLAAVKPDAILPQQRRDVGHSVPKDVKAKARAIAKAARIDPKDLEKNLADSQMTFRLKASTKNKLQDKADKAGCTMSELIVELIERFVNQK